MLIYHNPKLISLLLCIALWANMETLGSHRRAQAAETVVGSDRLCPLAGHEARLRTLDNVRLPPISALSITNERRLADIENLRLPQISALSLAHERRLRDIENLHLPQISALSLAHERRLRDIENLRLPQISALSLAHERRLRDIENLRLPQLSSVSVDHERRLREIEALLPEIKAHLARHDEQSERVVAPTSHSEKSSALMRKSDPLEMTDVPVLRASDLSEGQLLVVGVKGYAAVPYYPVRILARFSSARQMRFGNTLQEMMRSEWRDYAAESLWNLRTGPGIKEVFAEFRFPDGHTVRTNAIAPQHQASLGDRYSFPQRSTQLFPGGNPEYKLIQDFATGPDGWASYDYNGGYFATNVFYPLSSSSSGFVWTDDSRWRRDSPEHPGIIAPLVTEPRWLGLSNNDFSGTKIILRLRGEKLDLKGGKAYFFIMDKNARWVKAEPLRISNEAWQTNVVNLDLGAWFKTWENEPSFAPEPCYVTQLGVVFIGFSDKVTGSIQMNRFEVAKNHVSVAGDWGTCLDVLDMESPGLSKRPMPLAIGSTEQ